MTDRKPGATAVSRREFVGVSALGAAWILAGAACARKDAPPAAAAPPKLVHFSPAQAAQVDAIASRIIPTDTTPGAHEAGVVFFIDQALTTFAKDQAPLFADGLKSLGEATARKHGSAATFASVTPEQQDVLLREIEKTPFFGAMRFATIAGFLSLPKYGGNKDYVGWKLIGQDTAMEQKAPFGWYDRPENQKALLGEVL
ncbi:MAG TPA: gluconate 2-dehydrogenase subunit 3 family protein [Gemmatimonadaceae bacterium]|nr:gluconate 2-dehydrogenase subunit 3 family protein [Gemmatimonadaceae bacterium]